MKLGNWWRLALAAAVVAVPFVNSPTANAAAMSGTVKAGAGAANCSFTVQCLSFTRQCAAPTVNDIDASIRRVPAGFAGVARPYRWGAQVGEDENVFVVESFSATCRSLGTIELSRTSGTFTLPSGAVWVSATGRFPFANLTWSMG